MRESGAVRIITTGGTIDKVYFDATSEYEVGESHIPEILRESNVTAEWAVTNLMRKDSLDLTDEDRATIRRAVEAAGENHIVVTHGTDTMVQTARALTGLPDKTIVLTGSLHPARFKTTDAVFNVAAAFTAAQALPPGVYVAMNGRIFRPDRVRKNRERNRFEEPEA
ncbi:MAG TPA: asparaginase domain-containing protein [bacterium]|nr:asparaginase domain-containing protein [bacterium]